MRVVCVAAVHAGDVGANPTFDGLIWLLGSRLLEIVKLLPVTCEQLRKQNLS